MNKALALGFFILLASVLAEELTVTIPNGAVKGTQRWTVAGQSYYAFFSIRYAKPPTGVLRFQPHSRYDMTETGGNHLMLGSDYNVDACKNPRNFWRVAIDGTDNGSVFMKHNSCSGGHSCQFLGDCFLRTVQLFTIQVRPTNFTPNSQQRAPVAADPWSGVYDATYEKNICYQVNVDSDDENEDCLTLNVYTPINPLTQTQNKLPVMVYIHGGGFNWGSGQTKGATGGISPGYIMDSQLIMVSINYRLGPFGFLSTGDTVIPGNAGLKDQTLALKWVQNNIAYFGGDVNKVTIFGQSAGGASVGYQLLSPSAAGLFGAAMLESGTALCPWAYQRNQTEITYKTASFIDSRFDYQRDSQQLLNFLQNVDAKAIDNASKSYTTWAQSYTDTGFNGVINGELQQGFYYAPVVEVEHDGAFLTKKPYEAFAEGSFNKVPIFIGACSEEGLMSYNQYLQWTLSVYDLDHSILVPQGMYINNQQTKSYVGDQIKNMYSPYSDMQYNLLSGIQYYTDQNFQKSLFRHAELQSQYTDVYFYMFSYSGDMGGNTEQRYPGSGNVTHTEEGNYIFDRNNPNYFSQADQLVHQRIVKIWTNFATYKNPTPSQDSLLQNIIWPKVSESNFQYVDIGENLQVLKDPKKEKYSFWKNLFNTYGVRPFETY